MEGGYSDGELQANNVCKPIEQLTVGEVVRGVFDNHSHQAYVAGMRLDQLTLKQPAVISAIDWAALGPIEAKRLREFGFDEGVMVEALHSGSIFGRDPIACRVGRMTVAIRRAQAAAVQVSPTA
jgi:ferrous iron transport protein A